MSGLGGGLAGGKGDAKIMHAMENVGQGSVVGVWSYQGSKPFVYKGRLYNVMGDTVQCVDPKNQKVVWKKAFGQADKGKAGDQKLLDSVLTPPALVHVLGDASILKALKEEEQRGLPEAARQAEAEKQRGLRP